MTRLNANYLLGVLSPGRHVRTRLYFTSGILRPILTISILFDLVCTPTASSDPDDPILTMFNLYLALMTLLDLHVKRTIWPVLTPMTLHDRSFWSLFTFIWPQWPFMALLTFSDFILTLMTRRSYLDPNSHFLAPLTFSRPTWHFFDLAWPLFILNNLFRSIFDPGDPL